MPTNSSSGLELRESMYGFVASTPQLTYTENGDPRLYFKAGQEHRQREPDGSWTKLPTTFHDVVAFNRAALFGIENLQEQSRFLAQGSLRHYVNKRTNAAEEQFEATRFLPTRPRERNTTSRAPRRSTGRDAPAQDSSSGQIREKQPPEQESSVQSAMDWQQTRQVTQFQSPQLRPSHDTTDAMGI